MKIRCPNCGTSHDVSYKTILEWVTKSEKLRKAISSQIGKINAQKRKNGPNPNMRRGDSDYYSACGKMSAIKRRAERLKKDK